MVWFGRVGDSGDDGARAALVGVVHQDGSRTAGAGVYLSGRTLLTCAHVVNDALGQGMFHQVHPGEVTVKVTFPGSGTGTRHPARLILWVPPGGDEGAMEWSGDVALLELESDPPPAVRPVPWLEMADGQQVRAWYGGGQRFTYAQARVGSCDGRIGYLDGQLSGAAIGPGYSGGPLWSERDGAVVGLVAGQATAPAGAFTPRHVVRRSWGIALQAVRHELERAGAAHLLSSRRPAPAVDEGLRHRLLGALTALLGDPSLRADRARALAARCGLRAPDDSSAPTLEELADVLVEVDRALPTLAESLVPALGDARAREALDQLLAVGRLLAPSHLLSHTEHNRLLTRLVSLAEQDSGSLPRAVRGALPYVELPSALRLPQLPPVRVEEAVASLEQFTGDSTPVPYGTARVPALLRVVEYLAAGLGEPVREELRQWCQDVAVRLGIHRSALAERRSDAVAWAEQAGARQRSRVVVELSTRFGDPEDTYRCTVWQGRPDGSAARVSIGEDRPRPPQEIARLVRDVEEGVQSGSGASGVPSVAFVVDRSGLQLPVDEWDSADSDAIMPEVLGEDWHVVLRCPELRRRSRTGEADLTRRWAERGRSAPLVVDQRFSDARQVIAELKTECRDCGHVVLHGPREHRGKLLEVCLAMGVPVVLWDREADGHEQADLLDPVSPTGPPDGLPERVRFFRVKAYSAPRSHQARPALVWEDAAQSLPGELWLADPDSRQRTETR
ncbi:VMAP-C domain-containing protein [Wenjunlia tyrosinilytica]|uniref:vWA-MoxR associated protein C-terminal domain-containing protein n=1 Tax=Wenjunlia tyrosinilytica TaxID=1544741 RepID=A0A917ZTP8_9ACTN|nr:trypsin-like peptidase domain-containing protein [Wenjunlia tyrosinilytica]GGO91238.1 hypothetical protein GCM10012280_38620 [Wenjunlia tyrosinilytica]